MSEIITWKNLRIIPMEQLGSDDRGTTYRFNFPTTGEVLAGTRKAGSVSGRHYHTGASSQKDPEHFILLSGSAQFRFIEVSTNEEFSTDVSYPAVLEIPAGVWHEVVAKEDLLFLEGNSLQQHKDDTRYDFTPQG